MAIALITNSQGRPLPPVSDFPHFRKNFRTPWRIFLFLPFSTKFLNFISPKVLTAFLLVVDHEFRISPLFSLFQVISHCFGKCFFPPTFANFPLISSNLRVIYVFLTHFVCFSFPSYFDHDAFMHHTMQVGPTGRPC